MVKKMLKMPHISVKYIFFGTAEMNSDTQYLVKSFVKPLSVCGKMRKG